jgi:hypothetical protein
MGKHIKTKLDYLMIDELGKELYKLDPNNKVLNKFLSMDNFEGNELKKSVSNVTPTKEYGRLCTDCRGLG